MFGCVPSLFIRVLGISFDWPQLSIGQTEPVGGNAHYSFEIVLFISVKYWFYLSHKLDQYLLALSFYCQWWRSGIPCQGSSMRPLSFYLCFQCWCLTDPQKFNYTVNEPVTVACWDCNDKNWFSTHGKTSDLPNFAVWFNSQTSILHNLQQSWCS